MVENLYIGNNPKGATELIKKFNANPDSNSGIVTVPKVIGAGESVTIPAGRVAVLPNVQVDGTLNVEGEVFIPTGTTFSKVVGTEGNQTIEGIKTFSSSPIVPNATTDFQATSARGTNITVNVGAGQTYTTINQALEYLSGFYPLYKTTGVTATINLKAGFVMNEQVLVSDLNLGWITIVGEDAEIIITHTALTTAFNGDYPAFGVDKGGTSPVIGQLFRFNVEKVGGNKHGLFAYGAGSSAEVLNACGFIGAGAYGIYASDSSTVNAKGANASNAGADGIFANASSIINADSANASNAGNNGILAGGGSTINAYGANASNAGDIGILADGASTVNAQNALVQNQTSGPARVAVFNGSIVNARGLNATGGTVPALIQTANTLTGSGIIFTI